VLVATLILAGIPAVLAPSPIASPEATLSVLVHAPPSAIESLAPGVEIVEAYDSFALVRATEDRIARLQSMGIPVDTGEEGHWVGLQAVQFDTRRGEPAIPAELKARPADGGDLYIVHLIGPVKPVWLQELRRAGAEILQSIPTYAFLASMDGPTRQAVRSLRFVDWIGPYHPTYKIHSELASAQGTRSVQILTADARDTDAVVSALAARGLARVQWNSRRNERTN
jgi:hypothetical protein